MHKPIHMRVFIFTYVLKIILDGPQEIMMVICINIFTVLYYTFSISTEYCGVLCFTIQIYFPSLSTFDMPSKPSQTRLYSVYFTLNTWR